MFHKLLRNKIYEQAPVYKAVVSGNLEGVCYEKYDDDVWGCIYLAWDLGYQDVMGQLVELWKEEQRRTGWDSGSIRELIQFNEHLGKKNENQQLRHRLPQMTLVRKESTTFDKASVYHKTLWPQY